MATAAMPVRSHPETCWALALEHAENIRPLDHMDLIFLRGGEVAPGSLRPWLLVGIFGAREIDFRSVGLEGSSSGTIRHAVVSRRFGGIET